MQLTLFVVHMGPEMDLTLILQGLATSLTTMSVGQAKRVDSTKTPQDKSHHAT